MPQFPVVKFNDLIVGVDVHKVVGIPIHPYIGKVFLWNTNIFPRMNVFVNKRPICSVGAMGYAGHIPQGPPVDPTNIPYWRRYKSNVVMGFMCMFVTIFVNKAIAKISSMIPNKPKCVDNFIQEVTDSTGNTTAKWQMAGQSLDVFKDPMTWIQLFMPPIPFPGANGSTAVGNPKVQVNGGPIAIVAPLVATSCSDLPIVPNAATLGFSNVMVGMSMEDLIKGILVSTAKSAISTGVSKGFGMFKKKQPGKKACGCAS